MMEEAMELLEKDAPPTSRGAAVPISFTAPTAAALVSTLALALAAWVVAVRQVSGMDMGAGTELGSLGSFMPQWVWMMAAMMLPGAAPAVIRLVRDGRRVLAVPTFVASYLTVWTLVGVVVYAVYRPHEPFIAGALVVAAGLYELTPLKREFRRHCREGVRSGFVFGLYCVGSSVGLMLVLLAIGVMSVAWMVLIAVAITAQKVLAPKTAIDLPLALALLGLGVLIVLAPASVPGLTPPM